MLGTTTDHSLLSSNVRPCGNQPCARLMELHHQLGKKRTRRPEGSEENPMWRRGTCQVALELAGEAKPRGRLGALPSRGVDAVPTCTIISHRSPLAGAHQRRRPAGWLLTTYSAGDSARSRAAQTRASQQNCKRGSAFRNKIRLVSIMFNFLLDGARWEGGRTGQQRQWS